MVTSSPPSREMQGTRPESARVAHILPWRNIGGTEIATVRLVRAASTHGYRSLICHLPDADPVRRRFANEDVPTLEFREIHPGFRSGFQYLAQSRSLARVLSDRGIAALHCADIRGAFLTALAGWLARIPVICHVRNRYRSLPLRYRLLLRLVDHFVFVSRQTWVEFGHRVPRNRGTVLYDGIALPVPLGEEERNEMRKRLGLPAATSVVGMVARVARQKDYETLVEAASLVLERDPGTRFVVVGDHEEPAHREYFLEIQKSLDEHGIRDHFVFTGHRPDVDALLDTFDVFVLSTHWEGFPLVILEAMSHGLPVVATAVDGIPEIVEPGETGFLHGHEDPESLAKALIRLLENEAERTRIGETARIRVEREFSEQAYADRVGELYARLLPEGRNRQQVPGGAS